MTRDDVVTLLRIRITACGSTRSFAKDARLPEATVRRTVAGRQAPGDGILAALGLRRVERYEVAG